MKKIISISLVLMLLLGILAVPALAEETTIRKVGELSMLNLDEEKMQDIMLARLQMALMQREGDESVDMGLLKSISFKTIYFDSLDAMQMALNAGEIDRMEIYEATAKYLCANNDDLFFFSNEKLKNTSTLIANMLINGILANDFTFMMMEGREALRDEFNAAIAAIREDGTLEKLITEYIDGAIEGKEIPPIQIAKIDGAETIKVGVTGDLPPMDYVAADGTPAGFNTALLAEISKRLSKNIELSPLASPARSSALASGTVDVVFWTRTSTPAKKLLDMDKDEVKEFRIKNYGDLPEEQIALAESLVETISYETYMTADMPERTIITDPYFSDTLVMVMTKAEAEKNPASNTK
jgi:ABC-type amino acid transport substrate-binding protein